MGTENNAKVVLTAQDLTKPAFDSVASGFERMDRASRKFGEGLSGGTSNAIRNASYQLSDFIVQVQGGQRVTLALSQQLPQLLAGFGAFGAVAGVVVGVLPSVITAFSNSEKEARKLSESTSALDAAIGEVGKTSRAMSMENLYKEFNKANTVTRQAIVEQLEFQSTLISTQQILAGKSLSKTLEGFGEYGFLDKLKGAFAPSGAEKLSQELGVSKAVASDMLPAIRALKAGTGDAQNFMQLFGRELAANTNPKAQQLLKDIKAVADGTKDAYAAQTSLSDAKERTNKAGAKGLIQLEEEDKLLKRLLEQQKKRIAEMNAMAGDEQLVSVDTVSRQLDKAMEDKARAMDEAHQARLEALRIETEGEEAQRIATEKLNAELAKQETMAQKLGMTFSSAFEDAIVGGKGLQGILQGLAQDVARIFVRKTVTERLANSLSGMFSNFLPKFADGGDHAGGLRLVGENGPELEATGPARIFSAAQTRDMLAGSGGGGTQTVRVEVVNPPGRPAEVASASPRMDPEGLVVRVVLKDIANGGPISGALGNQFGLNRAVGAY